MQSVPATLLGTLEKRFLRPLCFADEVVALALRWYVRYRLSYADVVEWLAERGVMVNRSTIYRSGCSASYHSSWRLPARIDDQ